MTDKFLESSLLWAAASIRGQHLTDATKAFEGFLLGEFLTGSFHAKAKELQESEDRRLRDARATQPRGVVSAPIRQSKHQSQESDVESRMSARWRTT